MLAIDAVQRISADKVLKARPESYSCMSYEIYIFINTLIDIPCRVMGVGLEDILLQCSKIWRTQFCGPWLVHE